MGLLDLFINQPIKMQASKASWSGPEVDLTAALQRQRQQEMQARAKQTWRDTDNRIAKAQRTAALATLSRMAGQAYTPPQLADPNDQPRQTLRQALDDNSYASMSSRGDVE